jgi:hypothetical protein
MRRPYVVLATCAAFAAAAFMVSPAGMAAWSSSPMTPTLCGGPVNATAVATNAHCPLLAYERYADEPDVHIQTLDIGTGVTNNVGNPAVVVQVPNDGPETVSAAQPSFSPSGAGLRTPAMRLTHSGFHISGLSAPTELRIIS